MLTGGCQGGLTPPPPWASKSCTNFEPLAKKSTVLCVFTPPWKFWMSMSGHRLRIDADFQFIKLGAGRFPTDRFRKGPVYVPPFNLGGGGLVNTHIVPVIKFV